MRRKKQEAVPAVRGTRTFYNAKHVFTPEERVKLTEELTYALGEVDAKKSQLKTASSQLKSEIGRADMTARIARSKLTDGYEFQNVNAIVVMERTVGRKKFYLNAPGKPEHEQFLGEEQMTEADYQTLPLDGEPDGAIAATGSEPGAGGGDED